MYNFTNSVLNLLISSRIELNLKCKIHFKITSAWVFAE